MFIRPKTKVKVSPAEKTMWYLIETAIDLTKAGSKEVHLDKEMLALAEDFVKNKDNMKYKMPHLLLKFMLSEAVNALGGARLYEKALVLRNHRLSIEQGIPLQQNIRKNVDYYLSDPQVQFVTPEDLLGALDFYGLSYPENLIDEIQEIESSWYVYHEEIEDFTPMDKFVFNAYSENGPKYEFTLHPASYGGEGVTYGFEVSSIYTEFDKLVDFPLSRAEQVQRKYR